MSIEAINWVLNEAPGLPAHAFGVLLGLANHARSDGTAAYASQATLAAYARKTDRAVRNDIKELTALGLIIVSPNQAPAAHIAADARPVVYDLQLARKQDSSGSPLPDGSTVPPGSQVPSEDQDNNGQDTAGSGSGLPGGSQVPAGSTVPRDRKPTSDKPSTNQNKKTSSSNRRSTKAEPEPEHPRFAEFWAAYPKKAAKAKARIAFGRVVAGGTDPDAIIRAAVRYRDDPQRDPRYTAHPTTWLNDERWEDQAAEPPPNSGLFPPPPRRGHQTWQGPGTDDPNAYSGKLL